MFFFSIEFGVIFFIFFLLYWGLHKNYNIQNFLILAFNYFILFYFGGFYFGLVLACYTLFIYAASMAIAKSGSRTIFLAMIAFCVLNLSFFKYYPNFKDGFEALLIFFGLKVVSVDILFPLGISFYTFASITYLRAVYEARNFIESKTLNPKLENLPNLATYLSFFPTIIAGPIMRSDFFFAQLHKQRIWRQKNANIAIILLLFGIIKKVLIATYMQEYSSPILINPLQYNIIELILGISSYSVQIYCDFSGYVNLVAAFALMLGFYLPPNFNMPYLAQNLKDFWARWHISLSSFIRDFIYIPLGGSRKGFFLTQMFVLISFLLSGIWHGSTINFMIWGLLHGFGLVVLNIAKKLDFSLEGIMFGRFFGSLITFMFVTFAWIFFCYAEIEDSIMFLSAFGENLYKPIELKEVIILCFGFVIFMLYPLARNLERQCRFYFYFIPTILKPVAVGIILVIIFCFMPNGIPNFIYAAF